MRAFCFTLRTAYMPLCAGERTEWPLIERICTQDVTKEACEYATLDTLIDMAEASDYVFVFNMDRFVWPCLLSAATFDQSMRLSRLRHKFRCAMKEIKTLVYYKDDRKFLTLHEAFAAVATPPAIARLSLSCPPFEPEALNCQKLCAVSERILQSY